jgi:hypothetical protein
MLPALKSAFASLDPQFEYGYHVKSYPDRAKSRYCMKASVEAVLSVNLPGESDAMLGDIGAVVDLGKSSSESSPPTDLPSN